MIKRLSVSLAALAFLAGCPSADSFKPTKAIAEVEPNTMASGRTKTVEVRGNFTKWKNSLTPADINFGAGIVVDTLVVSNENLLIVTLDAADDAVPGPRDVDIDGEIAVGAVNVVPPFEIPNSAPAVAGDYVVLDIVGYETDWLQGRTVVTPSDLDVYTDGFDLFGATFTNVLGPTFIQAIVQVDLFAAAGPRGLSINGITTDDENPNAIDVVAATFTPLAVGNNPLTIPAGGTTAKVSLAAAPAGTVSQLIGLSNEAYPVIGLFDQDLGMFQPIAFFGDDDGFFGIDPSFVNYNFTAGKNLVLVAWDAYWLDELFFGNLLPIEDAL